MKTTSNMPNSVSYEYVGKFVIKEHCKKKGQCLKVVFKSNSTHKSSFACGKSLISFHINLV
jgi:hypothetical protein